MPILHPVLDDFVIQFMDIKIRAKNFFVELNENDFNTKPAESVWSIGECIEHLNLTGRLYLQRIYNAIGNADPYYKANDTYKHRLIYKKLILSIEPPYKKKIKTFSVFVPSGTLDFRETTSVFEDLQDRLIKSLEDANEVNWQKCKIRSPATKLVQLKLGEAFLLLAVHERRHLWQAQQVYKKIYPQRGR